MANHFYAYISRMRCVKRWALMRNTEEENIQEHSHMVAVLAHALALIERDILGGTADPDRCATAALFHDASEILTGDLPTPIKYFNPEIKRAYKLFRIYAPVNYKKSRNINVRLPRSYASRHTSDQHRRSGKTRL